MESLTDIKIYNSNNSSVVTQNILLDDDYGLDEQAVGIPVHPLQYRAIGVIQGIYEPLENSLTKGTMTTVDNSTFETVILGKAISAVKNHVDLNEVQNWVVYPHMIPHSDRLHLQVLGVFVPNKTADILPPNYFSIRGEVIYSSKKQDRVIVKICKNKTLSHKRVFFFKLELTGKIPDQTIKHFYSFSAFLQGHKLIIKNYIDLGLIAVNS